MRKIASSLRAKGASLATKITGKITAKLNKAIRNYKAWRIKKGRMPLQAKTKKHFIYKSVKAVGAFKAVKYVRKFWRKRIFQI